MLQKGPFNIYLIKTISLITTAHSHNKKSSIFALSHAATAQFPHNFVKYLQRKSLCQENFNIGYPVLGNTEFR